MSVHVTNHAIDRYRERVADVDRAEAYATMACADAAIEKARAFGARVVTGCPTAPAWSSPASSRSGW